jgi:hypothetical protein
VREREQGPQLFTVQDPKLPESEADEGQDQGHDERPDAVQRFTPSIVQVNGLISAANQTRSNEEMASATSRRRFAHLYHFAS